jgi:protein-L-isoaspartate O-methyltransferase
MTADTSESFFEQMYRHDADPWKFASSEYEQSRYAAIMRAIHSRRYRRAFEPGCSIGVLTASLATLCDQVIAMDISTTAVDHARKRCRALANVHIFRGAFPEQMPDGIFDLIVLSEIGYYLDEEQLLRAGRHLVSCLSESGVMLAVHWLGRSDDHILSGDRVHELLGTIGLSASVYAERHPSFRLDRWEKRAQATA